jgi:hypothetical protein
MRANRRLSNFFHRCESSNSCLFLDPGLDYIISRLVHPSVTSSCFKNIYTYATNRVNFDFEKLLVFTTGAEHHLLEYITLLSKARVPPREIHFIFSTRCAFISRQLFEAHGFLHRIASIEELNLPAWILDPDLATLELPGSVNGVLIEGGARAVERITDAVCRCPIHDYFSNLYFIGPTSVRIASRLHPLFKSGWTHIVFFDRSADVVTPFLAPMSYEAMVADVLGISYGITIAPNQEPVLFAETETVSVQLRNLPIPEAGEYVDRLVQSVRSGMDSLQEVAHGGRNFAEVLRRVSHETVLANQSLADHLAIFDALRKSRGGRLQEMMQFEYRCLCGTETSKEFIRSTVATSDDWRLPVRLLALYCATLPKAVTDIDELRQMIIDRWGLEPMAALWSLEEAGIVCERKKAPPWPTLRNRLRLSGEEATCKAEKPYQGYAPLVLRVVQKIVKKEWSDLHNTFTDLGIPFRVLANRATETKRILVVFLGGATYGELAALRLQKFDSRLDIDIMATELCGCKQFLDKLAGKPSMGQ